MPAKKKAAGGATGKKGGKKKKKKADGEGPTVPKMTAAELETQANIKRAFEDEKKDKKIEFLTEENEMLRTIAKELRLRLDKHIQSQTQLIAHLKSEIDGRNYQIQSLQESEQTLLAEKSNLADTNTRLNEDFNDKLSTELSQKDKRIQELTDQYNKLKDFEGKKYDLQVTLEKLEHEIQEERRKHIEHVAALDRRNMMQKDRLKNEMLRKIRETKLSLLAMTEDQLHTTTKRTIMENEQMTTELQYQSRETEKIIKRNQQLEGQNKALRRQIELASDAQLTLAKRTRFYQKQIKSMKTLLKNSLAENKRLAVHGGKRGKNRMRGLEDDMTHPGMTHDERTLRMETHIGELEEQIKTLTVEQSELHEEVANAKHATETLLNLQDEATTFILTCIQEVKELQRDRQRKSGNHIMNDVLDGINSGDVHREHHSRDDSKQWNPNEVIPMSLESVTALERQQILELLFQKLNYYDSTQDATLLSALEARNQQKHEKTAALSSYAFEKARYGEDENTP